MSKSIDADTEPMDNPEVPKLPDYPPEPEEPETGIIGRIRGKIGSYIDRLTK
ncbi:MAG: hypothetical protein BAJATHORv1_30480 [Candidatus Thorarchaeota archaeon]|nr:MAG: hypothetical protein BAJATHORv1_30480 [Candidatus Thorarchaeota archaeon]